MFIRCVHTLCCSRDRAVLPIFPNKNSSTSRKAVFPIEAGKQLYLGNNTTYEHQTCTNVLLRTCRFLWSPYHRPSLYWVMLKLI